MKRRYRFAHNKEEKNDQKRPPKEDVPKIYKEAAKALKKVNEGAELQSTIFQINHPNIRGIYSVVSKAIQNNSLLESIIDQTGMLNEKFDSDLAKVLVTEMMWGKKELHGNSKPVQETLSYKKALKAAVKKSSIRVVFPEAKLPTLRYIRINTLLVTISGTTQRLIDDGWHLVDTPDTYESFLESAANLDTEQFMKDYHFDDVLVFPPKSDIRNHKLVANGSLLMQDKASCLAALLLDPKPGSVVLDMCAAPGMKTTQLANLMENKGTIYAVDRHFGRFGEMKSMVERNCRKHNCVTFKLGDSSRLTSEDCPGVQYILVDPSCSGSGMASRGDDSRRQQMPSHRIQLLSNFQERLLVQALTAFPDVERVVYSTSSLLEEENERVLEKVLTRVKSFQVVPPQLEKSWEHRGNLEYSFGSDCLVADLEKDRTNGFFVAVLERIPGTGPSVEAKSRKRKSDVTSTEIDDNDVWEVPKKKKKAKKIKQVNIDDNEKVDPDDNMDDNEKVDPDDNMDDNEKVDPDDNMDDNEKVDSDDNIDDNEKVDSDDNIDDNEEVDSSDNM